MAERDVKLSPVGPGDKGLLRKQLSDYLIEFAEMEGVPAEVDSGGASAYRWFNAYWNDAARLPFFIEVDGEIVGFCLIRKLTPGWAIAEFSVHPSSRRQHIGSRAVEALVELARASGVAHLTAAIQAWNDRALRFWTSCGFVQLSETNGVLQTRRDLPSTKEAS